MLKSFFYTIIISIVLSYPSTYTVEMTYYLYYDQTICFKDPLKRTSFGAASIVTGLLPMIYMSLTYKTLEKAKLIKELNC